MKKVLRDLIEEDIDKIIDREDIKKKNFFFLIIHYLLGNNRINLMEISEIEAELSKEYEAFLKSFDEELLESNGEIIKVLRLAITKFNNRMSPILQKIEDLKEDANSKHNFN